MTTLTDTPAVHHRYDRLLRSLAAVGRGRCMRDLADAFALAGELEGPTPDLAIVVGLCARLGLTAGAPFLVRDAEEHGACR